MTDSIRKSPQEAAIDIWKQRFADAKVVFLAGSVVRGEETPYSDLDLVVVHSKVQAAYRKSFTHQGWPVEAFVHDPETLNYFFLEIDRPSGVPSLPMMVLEGVAIPQEGELSRSLRALAQSVMDAGPPEWRATDIQRARYFISDACDDIRAPRNHAELTASVSHLYELLADFYFRSRNRWSAKHKSIPRKLAEADPELAKQFTLAFDAAFSAHDPAPVLRLAETILAPHGGFLFEDFKLDAPQSWRKPLPPESQQ
jgi:SAM-dependent methyltransferase